MDICNNNLNSKINLPPSQNTNVFVIGERKSGKTALIKLYFEQMKVHPDTRFLVDSVKVWQNYILFDGFHQKISFIESDVDVNVLDQSAKFEEEFKNNRNILCLMLKSCEITTTKTQSRIKVFFEKLTNMKCHFTDAIIITNSIFKKKDIVHDVQHIYLKEMNQLFQSIHYVDFSENVKIFDFFKGKVGNLTKKNQDTTNQSDVDETVLDLKNNLIVDKLYPTSNYFMSSSNQVRKTQNKTKIFSIRKDEKIKIINKIIKENVMEVEEDLLPKTETNMTFYEVDTIKDKQMTIDNENLVLEDDEDEEVEVDSSNLKTNSNSLISISKEVFNFLKTKKQIKSSSVTEYILKLLKKTHFNLSFKNIQRRVYDAINVMCAIGILKKDKNNLYFQGGKSINSYILKSNKKEKENLREPVKNQRQQINDRQRDLVVLCSKLYLSQKLQNMNKNEVKRRTISDKLVFPFTLIKHTADASLVVKQDDTNRRLCILSDRHFEIFYEEEIMKSMLKDDFKNIQSDLKPKISNDIINYMNKHNLIEKYFNNFSNFNSNNFSLKEDFNTFNFNSLNNSKPQKMHFENFNFGREESKRKESSFDFLLNKHFREESNFSLDDFENNFMNNFGSAHDKAMNIKLENDFITNDLSTNFYSKNIPNIDDKM